MVKVSVCITTYNHAPYIAEALDSVLMQETDFEYEIILGEDGSDDGTREICIDYARRYPDRIRLFLRSRKDVIYFNGRPTGRFNLVENLKIARGEYVALLEGDDYWTDPQKLQKQVDFLNMHPKCSMCFHEAYNIWPNGHKEEYIKTHGIIKKVYYNLEDILEKHFIPTASMVFRRSLIKDIPPEMYDVPAGDWLLQVIFASNGTLAYIDGIWSVRRIHPGGLTSMASDEFVGRHVVDSMAVIDKYLDYRFSEKIRPKILAGVSHLASQWLLKSSFNSCDIKNIYQAINFYTSNIKLTSKEKRHVTKEVSLSILFLMRDKLDFHTIQKLCLLTAWNDPLLIIRNRGFLSVGLEAFLGKKVTNKIRVISQNILCR